MCKMDHYVDLIENRELCQFYKCLNRSLVKVHVPWAIILQILSTNLLGLTPSGDMLRNWSQIQSQPMCNRFIKLYLKLVLWDIWRHFIAVPFFNCFVCQWLIISVTGRCRTKILIQLYLLRIIQNPSGMSRNKINFKWEESK